jgi:ABC-type phosphate transport system substrate-binding protein
VPLVLRLSIYVLLAIFFIALRPRIDWKQLANRTVTAPPDTTLVLAGSDVAPLLSAEVVRRYRDDYPDLKIDLRGGTTAQALKDLADRRTGVAFLARPPSPGDQDIFTAVTGDTAVWYPIALGAILVVSCPARADTTIDLETIRQYARGTAGPARRFYAPDPNSGLCEAFLARVLPADSLRGAIYLVDDSAVIAAVLADEEAIGIISAFALRQTLSSQGAVALAVRAAPGAPAVTADNLTLSNGEYPLWSYLYVACRKRGDMQAAKFVTYVTGPRGQRQIEQTPYLPATLAPRAVVLSRGLSDS